MLKDSIRTDAYRDFVYDHKDLFKGKTILDVGCGTGILSMFSARAGARRVYAVDNSAIIEKAKANIFSNNLEGVVTCVKGKIEDVVLPDLIEKSSGKVDLIISEWMGYTLLYEAMLSSVIAAREKFLSPQGIMAPSHCTMLVAAVSSEDLILDTTSFWNDVYGFDMRAMKEKMTDDVLIRHLPSSAIASEPVVFKTLNLYDTKVADLDFKAEFELSVNDDVESLDAFVIYFDTFFLPSRDDQLPVAPRADKWLKAARGIAMSTAPGLPEKETHWRQGVCLINPETTFKLPAGQQRKLTGTIQYELGRKKSREADIEIEWKVNDTVGSQRWGMR
jgi:protein arginine N-methyltransferase 3